MSIQEKLEAALNAKIFTLEEAKSLEQDLEVVALVREKFRSGNSIEVERIYLSRRDLEGWL